MKTNLYLYSLAFIVLVAVPVAHGDEWSAAAFQSPSHESIFAAYGAGTVVRIQINPNDSSQARALIQMQENIGREQETNLFLVAISPLTAAIAFPRLVNGVNLGVDYLPVSQWTIEQDQLYTIKITSRENGYFLDTIDYIARWVEEQALNAYLVSGRLPLDYAESKMLIKELETHRREMSRIKRELDPNISDDEYIAVMGPLEEQERELRRKYFEVWGRMKHVPHIHPIFNSDLEEEASSDEESDPY